ncbi:glutathione-disulfide reductase, partial [Xanthomonas sp. Kuri4-1]
AAQHGARVALLEPGELGGTCVNIGCVPKKAMWLAADLAGKFGLAAALGFDVPPTPALAWQELVTHRQGYIANIHASYRKRLNEDGVVVVPRRGTLRDRHTVVCDDGVAMTAAQIVLATGAYPLRPQIPGAEHGSVSDDFFNLCHAPARVAVIGGGYIAVELAGLLQALGSRVEMFVQGPRLLERFDAELTVQLARNLHHLGVHQHFDYRSNGLVRGDDGRLRVQGTALHDSEPFDQVFFAIGRRGNTAGLGLEPVGVEVGDKGEVVVDAYQTTTVDNIHAIGDVAGKAGLTPVAIAAARKLMDRLFGGQPDARLDYDNVPSVVFSHPPLGQVGLSEEAARAQHGDAVRVYRSNFRPMLHALADSPQRSLFKLVCVGEEQRVVGVHLLGESADEMLQGFAVAVKLGVTKRQLEDTVALHPTSAEEVVLMR